MAEPKTPDRDDQRNSNRGQAITKFMAPVSAAWLLAVGGLLSWNIPLKDLLAHAGPLVAFAGAGLAFLAVMLTALENSIPSIYKQKMLFPGMKPPFPGRTAFTDATVKRAGLDPGKFAKRAKLLPEKQDEAWMRYYNEYRSHPTVAHFSSRHVAWRETAPLLLLLTILSVVVGALHFWLGGPDAWAGVALWGTLVGVCMALCIVSCWAGHRSNLELISAVLHRIDNEDKPAAQQSRSPISERLAGALAQGLRRRRKAD